MFKVAGVSTLKGEVKVRFANDMTRVKVLMKNGQSDVQLLELPEPMDKPAVVAYLKTTELYKNPVYAAAIDSADGKYNAVTTVKVSKPKNSKKAQTPNLEDIKARAQKEAEPDPSV